MYEGFSYYLREMISWLQEEWLWLPKKELDTGVVKEHRLTDNRFLLIGAHDDLSIYDEKYYIAQNFNPGYDRDGDFLLSDWDCLLFSVKFIHEELNRFKDWIKENRNNREKEILHKTYKQNLKPDEKLLCIVKKFEVISEKKLGI